MSDDAVRQMRRRLRLADEAGSGSEQLPPLRECCGSVFFEVVLGVEVAFEVEVIVDR